VIVFSSGTTSRPKGREVPRGVEGDIAYRGSMNSLEYINHPEATATMYTADGFSRSGDLGAMDADGYVRVTGRLKDIVIRGGLNISVRQVEDLLTAHPGVSAVAVVGIGADPHVRRKVADLWGRALVHRAIGQRVISGAASGVPPGPAASIGKLYFCPLVEDLADFRLSLEPLAGQFGLDDSQAQAQRWLRLANQARGTAIAGGSTFIQRNIVAERILRMPRS
jgi:acyl-CoA synthetase (AMP-forming)/AMP-acid ligase II